MPDSRFSFVEAVPSDGLGWLELHREELIDDIPVGSEARHLVYSTPVNLSVETRRHNETEVAARLSDLGIVVDLKTETRLHLCYRSDSVERSEDAIAVRPTSTSSVRVRHDDGFAVCAPFSGRTWLEYRAARTRRP